MLIRLKRVFQHWLPGHSDKNTQAGFANTVSKPRAACKLASRANSHTEKRLQQLEAHPVRQCWR